ncbi:MAG: hypothetical protein H0U31_10050 [Chloroflexia bacterium]|nr:hypothetical protein [Chloroflexia bacterium]
MVWRLTPSSSAKTRNELTGAGTLARCARSFLRSGLWTPATWPKTVAVMTNLQFSPDGHETANQIAMPIIGALYGS